MPNRAGGYQAYDSMDALLADMAWFKCSEHFIFKK